MPTSSAANSVGLGNPIAEKPSATSAVAAATASQLRIVERAGTPARR